MTHRKRKAGHQPVPRMVEQDGRYYWKPDKRLRRAFNSVPLGKDYTLAKRAAEDMNAKAAKWLASPTSQKAPARPTPRTPQTVAELITAFQASTAWKELRPRTQAQYRYELQRLSQEFGDEIAGTLHAQRVDAWWDDIRMSAPETGRHVASRGRVLFNWAGRKRLLPAGHNPFAAMGMGSGSKRRFRFSWQDICHLVTVADETGRASIGTALVIGFCCVQRIGDVITLTWSHVYGAGEGARLQFHQSKGAHITARGDITPGYAVDIPLPQAVVTRLGERQHRDTHLVSVMGQRGVGKRGVWRRWNEKEISRAFAQLVTEAIARDPARWQHLAGGQLRDCRRSGFVHLAENGCSVELITSWSGHSIQQGYEIVETYLPRTTAMANQVHKFMNVKL